MRRTSEGVWVVIGQFWESFVKGLMGSLPSGGDLARWLIQAVRVVAVLGVTYFLGRRVKRWSMRLFKGSPLSANALALISNAVFALVTVLGVSWLLALFGASWTAVLASLSVVTVAFSLALQDVLKNFVAGVYLLLEQPFRIGDYVIVKGVAGEVRGIDIRTTILRTDDGLKVLVPNSVVFTEVVTNRSAYPIRRVVLTLAKVKGEQATIHQAIKESLGAVASVEQSPAARITLHRFAEGLASLTVEFWQRDGGEISAVVERLRVALPDAEVAVATVDGAKVAGV